MSLFRNLLLASLLVTLSACGNGDDSSNDGHTHDDLAELAEHACEHGQDGPFLEVNASLTRGDAAEAVSRAHTAFRIALPEDSDGTHRGAVVYTATATGEVVFFLSADVPLSVHDGEAEVEIEAEGKVDACPAVITKAVTVDVTAGTEYVLELGPTDAATVTLVAVSAGGHAH
ncbi:hypothetical protein [Vulgatibacter incomptus]|uniref:Putative lipoprotein n=1 Tax=Vulgatibacter incomptus TaxID=1391653 RepID=A0A0K1PDK2_9BACT|nr:hypothetical protein [Vulgatibacter incomptus]AKU91486.1 putative lipoprotein [Vulgatibacter incomptus]